MGGGKHGLPGKYGDDDNGENEPEHERDELEDKIDREQSGESSVEYSF